MNQKQTRTLEQTTTSTHICQLIAEEWITGGMEKHLIELSSGLTDYAKITVVADSSYAPHLNEKVSLSPARLTWSRNNPFLLISIILKIRKLKPDVIHAHGKKAGKIVAMISPFIQSKTIVTLHNQCQEKWWMRTFSSVICVSQTIAKTLPSLPTKMIYNGIHAHATKPKAAFTRDKFNVISVGTLVKRKGFDTLIYACRDLPVNLHIVGSGPLEKSLHKLALSLGYGNQIVFHGHSNRIDQLLASADLTVIASRHEGFSYVFAESLYVETPVVSTRVPVACEYLDDQYLVPIDRPDQMRDAIKTCLNSPIQTKKNFTPLFIKSRTEFAFDLMVRNTHSHYIQVLNESAAKGIEIRPEKYIDT